MQSQVFQNFLSSEKPHSACQNYFFDKLIPCGKMRRRVIKWRKRECYQQLYDYIYGDVSDRVFILYGLRRTGKTTLIRQLVTDMDMAMKIVLSGTDSLGFMFTKDEALYDRCIMCHTTFIPYR